MSFQDQTTEKALKTAQELPLLLITLFFFFLSCSLPFPQELLISTPCSTPSSSPACIFPRFIIPLSPKLKAPRSSSSHTVNLSLHIFIYVMTFLENKGPLFRSSYTHQNPPNQLNCLRWDSDKYYPGTSLCSFYFSFKCQVWGKLEFWRTMVVWTGVDVSPRYSGPARLYVQYVGVF